MRISDWSSDVCSSDLYAGPDRKRKNMANLTLAQILALFPDNSTGAIDASDVRDALTAIFERTDGTNPIPALLFDTAGVSPGIPGHLHWNGTENTLGIDVSATGALQVGYEQWLHGRDTTGSPILTGTPVRITSGGGQNGAHARAPGVGR